MVLIQILEKVFFNVDKVLYILRSNRKFIEEQIQTTISPLLVAQKLNYSAQNQMLFLLEITYSYITYLLHQSSSSQTT